MNHFLLGVESTQHFRCVQQLGKQKKNEIFSSSHSHFCMRILYVWYKHKLLKQVESWRWKETTGKKNKTWRKEGRKKWEKTRNVVKVRVIFHYAHRLTAGERRRGAMNLSLHSPSVKLHFSFFFLLFGLVSLYIYTLASIYAPSFTQPSIPTIFSI